MEGTEKIEISVPSVFSVVENAFASVQMASQLSLATFSLSLICGMKVMFQR